MLQLHGGGQAASAGHKDAVQVLHHRALLAGREGGRREAHRTQGSNHHGGSGAECGPGGWHGEVRTPWFHTISLLSLSSVDQRTKVSDSCSCEWDFFA